MNQPLNEKVFGKIPEDFDAMLLKACEWEPAAQAGRKLTRVLVIALCLLLIACTALAVAHNLRIIDLFGIGAVDREEAATAIETSIVQSGGETSLGTFRVSEAYYDGVFLRFIVQGEFLKETVLISEGFMHLPDSEEIADLPGTRVGVKASADCPALDNPVYVYPPYGEGGQMLIGNAFIPEGKRADTLHFALSIDLLNIDDRSIIDSTVLSFTVPKTVEATTKEFILDIQTDFVAVDKATIARTPLEVFASIEYRPLLRVFSGFTVVPDDGYILKDGRSYFYGIHSNIPALNDGKGRVDYVLPVEHAEGEALTLWIPGTDQAIVIDLHTGEASVKKAITHFEGEDKIVEIVED